MLMVPSWIAHVVRGKVEHGPSCSSELAAALAPDVLLISVMRGDDHVLSAANSAFHAASMPTMKSDSTCTTSCEARSLEMPVSARMDRADSDAADDLLEIVAFPGGASTFLTEGRADRIRRGVPRSRQRLG